MKVPSFLFVVLLVLLGACGSDDEPVTTGAGSGGIDLEDPGDYRVIEVTEDGEPRPLVEGTEIAIRFADGRLSANAGCNHLGGAYRVEDGLLGVEGGLSMTEMGCDPPRHEQDEWLAGFLASEPTVEPTDDGYTLGSGRTTMRLVDRRVVEPDAELVGTTWTVDGFIDGDTAMSTTGPREPGHLRFEDNGFVTGNDGCNDFGDAEDAGPDADRSDLGLRFEVDGDRITFDGATVNTLMRCDDTDDDERLRAVLSGTVTYEIEASHLTLLGDDGRGVTFTTDPAAGG